MNNVILFPGMTIKSMQDLTDRYGVVIDNETGCLVKEYTEDECIKAALDDDKRWNMFASALFDFACDLSRNNNPEGAK